MRSNPLSYKPPLLSELLKIRLIIILHPRVDEGEEMTEKEIATEYLSFHIRI